MRQELIVKSKSLVGASDLTLLAPIKPGFVPALDAVTYKTRIKRLLKTLQGGRGSAQEYALLRPFSDAVERVTKIHSFRVTVLEPEDKVLLAVTFDGTWEAYIRVLWQKVGTLLDIIFCDTEGYVCAYDNSFEAWSEWVQKVQVETQFFFSTPGLTVDDVQVLRRHEAVLRQVPPSASPALDATRLRLRSAEATAWDSATAPGVGPIETLRQGLQSMAMLFRLTDLYMPGTVDGPYLQRAARDLLLELLKLIEGGQLTPQMLGLAKQRFARQLQWIGAESPPPDNPARRQTPLPSAAPARLSGVQGGILHAYEGMTHGALLLLAFESSSAAATLLKHLDVTTDATPLASGALARNIAFTYEGLRAAGLGEAQLALLPPEFREGMEARASMLGDFRSNHPRRWRLPARNWPAGTQGLAIELAAVHAVVQLRIGAAVTPGAAGDPADPAHPLHAEIAALAALPGIRLLSVEAMQRYMNKRKQVVEHFGFVDGLSQPTLDPDPPGAAWRNQVHLGEMLLGHPNGGGGPEDVVSPGLTPAQRPWLQDGSFLVVRKLRQDVAALHEAVAAATVPGLPARTILAKLMGRYADGRPLPAAGAGGPDDFNYDSDAGGSACPIHAHIRRANPRPSGPGLHEPAGQRFPRLMRRGMSYGPRYRHDDPAHPDNSAERGLFFMTYNANIGEQFEVVQRWLTGGNSSGGFSGQGDPLLGVAENGQRRVYRFEHGGRARCMALDGSSNALGDTRPFVRLEWGAYLFAPSLAALTRLRELAASAPVVPPVWSATDGAARIRALQQLEDRAGSDAAIAGWKAALEDPEAQEKFHAAGIWAAIREQHGGVLRTPYGVLVAGRAQVQAVLADPHGHTTVAGYHARMLASIGEIYLGLDQRPGDDRYASLSEATNRAIGAISGAQAFDLAFAGTQKVLQTFIGGEKQLATMLRRPRWELNLDAKEVVDAVLALLCQHWFGLPPRPTDPSAPPPPLVPGAWRWDWTPGQPPIYPAHFTAPSRYIFQPRPGAEVEAWGTRVGQALTAALAAFIAPHCNAGTVPAAPGGAPAPIAAAILAAFPSGGDEALVARTFVGALMGMLPTLDGNLRLILNEWLRDGSFWRLRQDWAGASDAAPDRARRLLAGPLRAAMQLRPSPELVWRRAAQHHAIGPVAVVPGELIVLALVSATQQTLAEGGSDVSPIFGGDRSRSGHPTHACPGYSAAMGVLLGLLAGFLNVPESMRPSPAPLAFTFEGPAPVPPPGPAPGSPPGSPQSA